MSQVSDFYKLKKNIKENSDLKYYFQEQTKSTPNYFIKKYFTCQEGSSSGEHRQEIIKLFRLAAQDRLVK